MHVTELSTPALMIDAEANDAPAPGERVRVVPAHVDPTMALHEAVWLVQGDEVLERWDVDLRGWG